MAKAPGRAGRVATVLPGRLSAGMTSRPARDARVLLVALAAATLAACARAPDPRLERAGRELRGEAEFRAEAASLAWQCRPESRAEAYELDAEERRVADCKRLLDMLTGNDEPAAGGGGG